MMNGRNRLLKVLEGEKVDRVPIVPFFYNNYINEFFNDPNADGVEKGIEVYEHFGFDIILRTCNNYDYMNEAFCDSKNWRVSEMTEGVIDKDWSVKTVIKTPEKEIYQLKKYHRATQNEVIESIVEYFIKDESDFRQFEKYQPSLPQYDCSIITKARELLGDKGLAAPWVEGAFNIVSFFRKLDNLIIDAIEEPNFYMSMMNYFGKRHMGVIKQFSEAGADILCSSGNVANSLFIGPNFFREHVLPYEIEFTKKAKSYGAYYLYHNCGYASSLLDMYSQIKMNIYESLSKPPYGDTDLKDALNRIDKSIALIGNIDQIEFLIKASPNDVEEEVRRVMEVAKQRDTFILGTSDYISEGTPYENIKALAEAGLKYGNR